MKLAYVCGPYRAADNNAIYNNIQDARRLAVELWWMGFAVICPHLNSAFFGGVTKEDNFVAGCVEMVSRCDLLVLTRGRDFTEGMLAEIATANAYSIPVCIIRRDGIVEGVSTMAEVTP